nr:radical SAM protein [Bradyrhizobium liaoningense]
MGPDGIHLFSRSSGLNILVDEVSVPPSNWSNAPRQVSIALTNACELRCPYCYAPKHRSQLEYDKVARWLLELDDGGCLGVGFGGGEPTLHKDFVKLCKFVSQSTKLAATFTTHSHRLNERIVAELQGHVHFIRVSMDGVGSTYETLRGRSFNRFCGQLELVRMLAPFGVNFVVNDATFPEIDKAVSIAIECGASEFLLLPERATHACRGINARTRFALRKWISAFRGGIRLAISEADKEGLPICNPLMREDGLRSYAHIDASGTLRSSSFDDRGVSIDALGVCAALQQLKQRIEKAR